MSPQNLTILVRVKGTRDVFRFDELNFHIKGMVLMDLLKNAKKRR